MRRHGIAALLALCLLCTACAPLPGEGVSSAAWPPVCSDVSAPEGVELPYTAPVALYLPTRDGLGLAAEWTELALDRREHPAEAVARALLSHRGSGNTAPLGGDTALSLSGERPVEVACGVCTVNLAATALQLSYSEQYTVCLALARTLCELEGVHHVNVLIAGRAVSLDITGSLPCGAVAPHPGEELAALWEQMEAKRAPLGESASLTPLTAAAALYFPAADGQGILPEVRNLTFAGQHPQQLTLGLLGALSAGPRYLAGAAAGFDPASDLILAPEITELDTGGRQVTLYFSSGMAESLEARGLDAGCYLAAVVRTLTDFVPNLTQVRFLSGDDPWTAYSSAQGGGELPGGVARRGDFAGRTATNVTLYLAREGKLCRVTRPLPCGVAEDPAALLGALFAGPTEAERAEGISPVWPPELEAGDLIGAGIREDTLLINLSPACAEALRGAGLDERLAAYAAVHTLLESKGLRRLRFFFGGEAVESLGGELCWSGEFWPAPSLTDEKG